MPFLGLLGFIFLKAKLKPSLFSRNLKPWQNCNSTPKLKTFKLIGKGNFAHWHPFWLIVVVLIIDSFALTPIIKERTHRHVVELGFTLLHHASLPLKFWDFAFIIAVYLINRIPIDSLNFSIPFHVLFKQFPDYSFLKTFGCSCSPLLRSYNNH